MKLQIIELNPVVSAAQIEEALKDVIDPELGLDIVNLGLVYTLQLVGGNVAVTMTLTTPGCPMHGSIKRDILYRLERLPGVEWVDIELVWDPPWSPEAMSDEARRQLSWL